MGEGAGRNLFVLGGGFMNGVHFVGIEMVH